MSITFYTMSGCGFCNKARNMFSDEISSGEVTVVDSSRAPKNFRGFPTFTYNGKHHSGLPSSKNELYSKLGFHRENFTPHPHKNTRPRVETSNPFNGVL